MKVGDLTVTVKGVTTPKKLTSPFGTKTGNWVMLNVTIQNGGKEAVTVNYSYFKLLEKDGTEYETDSDALLYIDSDENLFLEKINPKLSKTGKVMFAVPASLKVADLKVKVSAGAFGSKSAEIELKA